MSQKIGAQSIGSRIQKVLVGILIGFLVIGFAIWGINDVFSPSSNSAVATIGDTEINEADFERAFKRELESMAQETGTQLSHEEAYQRGVHATVLGGLIQQSVISVDADDLGIGVNRFVAREEVSQIDVFKDELTGKFSEQKYESILAQNRVTRSEFEGDIERDLRRAQTVPAIIEGVVAPAEFAEQRYKFLTEQRKARVLTLTRDSVPDPDTPDDETIKTFIAEREAAFTAPEYRRFMLLRIEEFDLTPNIEVEDEDLRAAFEYKVDLGELGSAETRSLVQLVAPDEATAQKAAELLTTDQDPEVIASGLGLVIDSYTDASRDNIVDPETSQAAYEMKESEIKVILGTLGSWYAVKVTGITPAVVPDFETMKQELTESLKEEHAQEKLYDLTSQIEGLMDESVNLEDIAKETGVTLQSFDYIDRLGQTQDGVKLSGIAHLLGVAEDDILLQEIFTNDIGYETDLFQTSMGGWAAVKVTDVIDSVVRPFDDIKEQASNLWKTVKIDEAINELMLETAGKAQTGTSLDDLAKEIGAGASIDDAILIRSAQSELLGPTVAVGLLEGKVGDIERGQGLKPLTRQVAELTAIVANTDGLSGQFSDVLQEQASVAIRADLQRAYQNAIITENPLIEKPEKIKSLLGIDSDG